MTLVTSDGSCEQTERLTNPWLVLMLLTACYALSGADRQLVAVLAEPLRQEFGLSDTQLGLLSGFMFALFYTAFGVPLAWLADRANRVKIIAAACFTWSLFTAATGLSTAFSHLAIARAGVAIGEAGASPPAYALIADYFPPQRRGTMLGIYSVGLPFGIAVGTALGGLVAAHFGWRAAFFAMAVPGVVLAFIIAVVIRHPRRGRLDASPIPVSDRAPPLIDTVRQFVAKPVLWSTTLAGCLSSMSSYAVMVWMPAFLMRERGMSLEEIGTSYSLVTGAAMVTGMLAGGRLLDVLGKRRPRAGAVIPGIAYLLTAPLMFAAIWTDDWHVTLAMLVLPFALMMMWLPPVLVTLHSETRAAERATISAIFLLLAGIVGNGGGPALVGALSDGLAASHPGRSLAWALTCIVPVFILAGIVHLASALAPRTDRSSG